MPRAWVWILYGLGISFKNVSWLTVGPYAGPGCRGGGGETGQRNDEQGLNRGRTLVKDLNQVWRR